VLGQLLAAEDRVPEAAAAYRRALRMDPSYVPALRALAEIGEREGRIAEAIAHWRHIAEILPAGHRSEALESLRRLEGEAAHTPGTTTERAR